MKYRLESTIIEAVDTYVRITMPGQIKCTRQQCPDHIAVSALLREMQGYEPNRAQLQACGRAAFDALHNKIEVAL